MQEIVKYNNIFISLNRSKKNLIVEGPIGYIEKCFNGNNLFFIKNKLFLLTKVDIKIFLNLIDMLCSGVINGYYIELTFIGLTYRFLKIKNFLLLKLGFSHYIKYNIPLGIHIIGYKRKLIIYGMNIIELNKIAQQLKFFKKPTIYKGKGIQIMGELVRNKIGKQK
jgi:ribosomal protein L6P/L9E